ncbi:MAG: cytochrome c biogenesis protein CcsA [Magnetococcales bacterium]|nr:cytochrome c biogenesis protein CcsA [Magnetococcales bacterium]
MQRLAKWQLLVGLATVILLAVGLWMSLAAPLDFQQGNSVRILYAHVPSAKMSLLIYLFVTGASIAFLWKKSETADILAEAAVPVGAAFSAVTLASGSIWGKPMWGAWWAWDARLTSMLVLLIIYVGLMALRNAFDDQGKAARATAVLAIIGAIDLPIIHYSVTWWRTLHQPASFDGPGKISVQGPLLTPLLVMSAAFILLGIYLVLLNARVVATRRRVESLEDEEAWNHG